MISSQEINRINIELFSDKREEIIKLAREHGQTLSGFIKSCVFSKVLQEYPQLVLKKEAKAREEELNKVEEKLDEKEDELMGEEIKLEEKKSKFQLKREQEERELLRREQQLNNMGYGQGE